MRIALIFVAAAAGCALLSPLAHGEAIPIPNASFESPTTGFVSINIDHWQKAPKPESYVESGGFLWEQLLGLFKNTAPTSPDHIDNLDGNQGVWLFAVPEVALFQDYDSTDWRSTEPSHAFDATFKVGNSYQLTAGIIGTGGAMQQGATLELSLYFRDANSNKVTVAAVSVTNTVSVFSNNTHFIDFHVDVPAVKAGDPWAGQHIGIQVVSTVDTNSQGGYWDLDNFRLASASSTSAPVLLEPRFTDGQFQFTVASEPGLPVEALSATDPSLPLSSWESLGILTNASGSMIFTAPASDSTQRFFTVRRLP